jgi:hypothetical protein
MHAKQATEALVDFVMALDDGPSASLCVTYFDEADELDFLLWIFLRLLSNQDKCTAMLYVFMATKSRIDYFAPSADKSESSSTFKYIYSSERSAFSATAG